VSWPAAVSRLEPGSELWTTVVPQLTAKRLNSAAGAELEQHWAAGCVVSRLVPVADVVDELRDASLAAPPRPTPATRATRKPFRLHRVKGSSTNR